MPTTLLNVLIASPLEPELVERIAAVDNDARLRVIYRADLLGEPRYPGDHFPPIQRTADQTAEWARLLAEADVLLDVDQPSTTDLVQRAPRLRWIQASSSGIGEWIRRLGLVEAEVIVTNAAGLHARPLAEYVVFAMLYFAKRWVPMLNRPALWLRRIDCASTRRSVNSSSLVPFGLPSGYVGRWATGLPWADSISEWRTVTCASS